MKAIGILGGMGPDASTLFYQQVLSEYQRLCKPQFQQDYPEIFLYNLPIPDPISGIKNPERFTSLLIAGLKKLESVGVNFITVPCNTAHIYIDEMRKSI